MQVQPYQHSGAMMPTGIPSFGGDPRINVPSGPAPVPPSLFAIFAREILKRKTLLIIWLALTAALAAALITKLAKPIYRAEGKLSYIPNYRAGVRPLYNPPNIQSMAQLLKTMDSADHLREKLLPGISKEEFARNLHVEVSKMSELLDVSYDAADPDTATRVAGAVMDESIVFFGKYRQNTLKERAAEVRQDVKRAMADLEKAKGEYQKAHADRGVSDLKSEIESARLGIVDEERALRAARETHSKLKAELAFLKNRQDNPAESPERGLDESFIPILQAMQNEFNQKLQAVQSYESAKFRLEQLQLEEERSRVLAQKGIQPLSEYQKTVADLRSAEALVKQYEDAKELIAAMQAKYEQMKKQVLSGKPLRLANNTEMDKAAKDLATMPEQIRGIEESIKEKRLALNNMTELQRDLGPKEEEIALIRNRLTELSAQLTDSQYRDKDPNADDLKIATAPTTGGGPFATNVPKLAASVFGGSAVLFLGYIAMFAIPPVLAGQRSTAVRPAPPRAVLAMVPVATSPAAPAGNAPAEPVSRGWLTSHPMAETAEAAPPVAEAYPTPVLEPTPIPVAETPVPAPAPAPAPKVSTPTEHEIIIPLDTPAPPRPSPSLTAAKASLLLKDLVSPDGHVMLPPPPAAVAVPVPPAPAPAPTNPAVMALASRISQEGVDRGSIVLFTPTQDELLLTPIIGDLGRQLSLDGSRVLVFDARGGNEHPAWAGPAAPGVAGRVDGYLNGRSDATNCFVPTMMKNVEYSRADLSNGVSGVMSAHRFRQLVEEMRERYSLVLMVAPTMVLDGNDPLLGALAEGLVVVTENNAQPNQIRAYIESLADSVPAPVYGALSVPRA